MNSILISQVDFMSPEYDLCIKLRQRLLRKPLNLEFTESQLESESAEFHFAVFNDENILLGCLSFKILDNTRLKMRQVAIDEQFQNSGIGSLLVKEAEKWALENHYTEIHLHARESAVNFYRNLGYQIYGEQFEEVTIPHWFMKKILNQPYEKN